MNLGVSDLSTHQDYSPTKICKCFSERRIQHIAKQQCWKSLLKVPEYTIKYFPPAGFNIFSAFIYKLLRHCFKKKKISRPL